MAGGITRRATLAAPALLAMAPATKGEGPVPGFGEAVTTPEGDILFGPRIIPVPRSISAEGQAFLRTPIKPPPAYPAKDDLDGWLRNVEAMDGPLKARPPAPHDGLDVEVIDLPGGAWLHVVTPHDIPADRRHRARLAVHGGGFLYSSPRSLEQGIAAARESRCKAYSIEYRTPPKFRYPVPLDDVILAYEHVIKSFDPRHVVMSGQSAGGNLVAAAILKLRDHGRPMPAAAILRTPDVDLTESGESFTTNRFLDPLLRYRLTQTIAQYAGGADLTEPYLSPLFGDFTKGFPPAFLQSGTRDLLLSSTVRMHRALRNAGVTADLHIWEAMPHGGFWPVSPENDEIIREMVAFIERHW